jgi:predicted ester cyclase
MVLVEPDRAELESFYRQYLRRCNEHRFDELGEFVDEDVESNGASVGLRAYGAGLAEIVDVVPDFHWELQHLLVDGHWLSARLVDSGTTRGGRAIDLQELAVYRVEGGRIVQVWGDLDRARLPS